MSVVIAFCSVFVLCFSFHLICTGNQVSVPATLFSMFSRVSTSRFCVPTSRFRSGGVFGSRSMSGVSGSSSCAMSRSPPGSTITGIQRRALWHTQSHGSRCSPSPASASASSC